MSLRDDPPLQDKAAPSRRSQPQGFLKRRPLADLARGIPVVLVGPHGLFAEGLRQILRASNFRVIAGLPALGAADADLVSKARLVIIMDSSAEAMLPQLVGKMREDNPSLRFVILVDTTDRIEIAAALRVPAHAFLGQRIGCEPLMKALDVVLGDGAVLSLDLMDHLMSGPDEVDHPVVESVQPATPSVSSCRPLSEREIDILRCLTDGDSNKLIARRFKIAESTVKIHIKGILRKINVQNRTQAAIWAMSCMPPSQHTSEAQVAPEQRPAV